VDLAERDQTHLVQSMLARHLGKVDDGTGEMMHNTHGLVVLHKYTHTHTHTLIYYDIQ